MIARRSALMNRVFALSVVVVMGAGAPSPVGVDPESLDPSSPRAYLEAGEWAMIGARDNAQRAHARQLLGRALAYAHEAGSPRLASSACIALASIARSDEQHARLWDLALVLDPARRAEWERVVRARRAERRAVDRLTLRCLSSVRLHDMPTGEDLFGRADVAERIRELAREHGMDPDAVTALIAREIESANEDSCRGRLFVGSRSARGERVVCPDHLRGVGLAANDRQLRMFLTLETALSGAGLDGWGVAGAVGRLDAAVPPTVGRVVEDLGVRPTLGFYRNGQWVSDPTP